MANDGKYVLDMQVEKKGKGFAGWKSRQLRLSQDAVLTYFTIPQMGDGKTQEELKGTIDLMVEGLNQVQPDKKLKGKLYKYGWIMQTDGRKYEFASSDEKGMKSAQILYNQYLLQLPQKILNYTIIPLHLLLLNHRTSNI